MAKWPITANTNTVVISEASKLRKATALGIDDTVIGPGISRADCSEKLPKPGPKDKELVSCSAPLPQNTGLEPEKEKYHVNGDTKKGETSHDGDRR